MKTEDVVISQGFECEIDRTYWFTVEVCNSHLSILFMTRDSEGEITLGRSQIQNLINFLERAKKVVKR